jgi:hypothetical protein
LAHGYETGDKVLYTKITGTTITGLTSGVDYYIIAVGVNTVAFADTYNHAIALTKLPVADADDAIGGGTFTLTGTAIAGSLTAYVSNDGVNWVVLTSPSAVTISAASSTLWESVDVTCRYVRVALVVTAGSSIDATIKINATGEAQ